MKYTGSIFLSMYLIFSTVSLSGQSSVYKISESEKSAITGKWRGVFELRPGIEVPFNFEIKRAGEHLRVYLLNAEEKLDVGAPYIKGDSLFIPLDQFDNELAFKMNGDRFKGSFRKQNGTGVLPVYAEKNKLFRFIETGTSPSGSMNGTYDIFFHSSDGNVEKAVGLFTQKGNRLRATFMRITGDSRYLEGIVEGNRFYLSSFIGSSPSYYNGTFTNDGKLQGEVTGARSAQAFDGIHNETAALPDAYSLTNLKNGSKNFAISLPDMQGKPVSLKDKKYQGKVVIITIGGTWCPNCMDETSFLSPWYSANRGRGVELISIQYERQTDSAYLNKVLTRFKKRFNIQYDILVGGIADKQAVITSLPSLNNFISFPTTIFINRQGEVAKIHTGYSGPATGKYYTEFVNEFNALVDVLLK